LPISKGRKLIDQGLNPQLDKLLVYTTVFEKVSPEEDTKDNESATLAIAKGRSGKK